MAKKPVEVICAQCDGKGKKKYPGKILKQTCNYCGGLGTVVVWR